MQLTKRLGIPASLHHRARRVGCVASTDLTASCTVALNSSLLFLSSGIFKRCSLLYSILSTQTCAACYCSCCRLVPSLSCLSACLCVCACGWWVCVPLPGSCRPQCCLGRRFNHASLTPSLSRSLTPSSWPPHLAVRAVLPSHRHTTVSPTHSSSHGARYLPRPFNGPAGVC